MGFSAAVVGAVVMGGSAYMQYQAAEDQADAVHEGNDQAQAARRDQMAAESRRADLQTARSVRQAVRQARVARSMVVNTAANSGTSFATGASGGAGSVVSQARSNLGFLNEARDINQQITAAQLAQTQAQVDMQNNVAGSQADAAMWGAVGQLGKGMFSYGMSS